MRAPRISIRSTIAPFLLFFSAACSGPPEPVPVLPVLSVELAGISTVHRSGDLLLAGQPSQAALQELAAEGVRLVIDLRKPGELTEFDEPTVVRGLGMAYENPAFRAPEELTATVFDEVRRLIRDHRGQRVLLHCGSANRVGAVWLAARVLDEGVPLETALEEAHRVGLRSEEYEAQARAYVLGPDPARWASLLEEIRATFPEVDQLGIDALAARLAAGSSDPPVLLDVRAEEEYAVSHLAGALRAETKDGALQHLRGAPRDREIVVYCSVGYRSSALAEELAAAGFTSVRNLEGSIFAWANAGHPVHRGGERVSEVHPYDEDWGQLLHRSLWPETFLSQTGE